MADEKLQELSARTLPICKVLLEAVQPMAKEPSKLVVATLVSLSDDPTKQQVLAMPEVPLPALIKRLEATLDFLKGIRDGKPVGEHRTGEY